MQVFPLLIIKTREMTLSYFVGVTMLISFVFIFNFFEMTVDLRVD
jgi:hypothetical protein